MASVAPTPTKARPAVPPSVASKSLEELQVLFVDVRGVLVYLFFDAIEIDGVDNDMNAYFFGSRLFALSLSLFLSKTQLIITKKTVSEEAQSARQEDRRPPGRGRGGGGLFCVGSSDIECSDIETAARSRGCSRGGPRGQAQGACGRRVSRSWPRVCELDTRVITRPRAMGKRGRK